MKIGRVGASVEGYSSDLTRTAIMGSPPSGYQDVHAVVEAAVQAATAAARAGVQAHVVDDAARSVITSAGYGDYFVHRTGRGMGVDTVGRLDAAPLNTQLLFEKMQN